MKTEIITAVYNEEYLLPYFINNHKWVDKITFLYDVDSTDNSKKIINDSYFDKNHLFDVNVVQFKQNGLNDFIMTDAINQQIRKSKADYIICLDADEFIIGDVISEINKYQLDYYNVSLFQMIKHDEENDWLHFNSSIENQRKYGYIESDYIKPCIFKNHKGYSVYYGKHFLMKHDKIQPKLSSHNLFKGMHLNLLNKEFALERYKNRCNRISDENRKANMGIQYFQYNESVVLNKFSKNVIKVF